MSIETVIKVRNLEARYGEKTILENINIDIYKGEVTVILGSSGCGKTTLLRNILRLQDPHSGTVEILGQDVTKMDEQDFDLILRRIGMLFQNGALLNSISLYENISIPLELHTDLTPELIDRIIRVKLHLVNLDNASNLLPSELSGGMRKRAALARALALDPEILFCDEPSAGLDPLTSESLDELILHLQKQLNMTIVIVTHELASIHRVADRIIFLDSGRMLFEGTLEEGMNSGIPEIDTFFSVGRY